MNFLTLTKDEFRNFADNYRDKSFYQTPEIAALRQENGWTPYYFGVSDASNQIIAGAMIVGKEMALGTKTFYCPGGPLVDYENTKLTNFFFKNLFKKLKAEKGIYFSIDPYYELIERDRDGLPKAGGFNRKKAIKNLTGLGFKPQKVATQPKYLFVLDINGRTPDQILADFKRNTRNHVRKAEKMGVKVRELKREELNILKKITEATSERRHFEDKPLSYYEQMYDLFHDRGELMYMVAEVEADLGNVATPLSAAMFMTYGDEIIYLFSGSDEKYMHDYNAQYAIQWHMIKYAAEHGFKTYNFYGIQGLPDKNSKDYGIYDFKKGFTSDETGRVIELLGTYKITLSPLAPIIKILNRFKH